MHKKFDEVFPYTYFLVRKSDGLKYVGARYANVGLNLTPNQDFGKVYFTSGSLMKDFRDNPDNYHFRVCYTFDTVEDTFDWEGRVVLRVCGKDGWANQGWGRNYGENPNIGRLISEGKNKVKPCGRTSIEIGAETLKDWIYNTEEGAEYRKGLSERSKRMWDNMSDEDKERIQQIRRDKIDFKAARAKASITLSKVGEDGLTGNQRSAIKAAQTSRERGSDIEGARKYVEWVYNTPEGEAFRKRTSERVKDYWENTDPDVIEANIEKWKESHNRRTEEEKERTKQLLRESRLRIVKDGKTAAKIVSELAEETKVKNGTHAKVAKKRGELFNKKLGEMSEEEFEEYCAKYIPRLAKSFRTRRNKYLQQLDSSND